jgi:hypothetical protein
VVGENVGISVGGTDGSAVGSSVEVSAIVGRAVGEDALLVGCTTTTSGEQAVANINKPKIMYLVIKFEFIFSPFYSAGGDG